MTVRWKFEAGRLEACGPSGDPLRAWMATGAMGLPLAALLNQSPDLSRLLLWPLLEPKERVTEHDILSSRQITGHHSGAQDAESPAG